MDILVVEDTKIAQLVAKKLLTDLHHVIDIAETGELALQYSASKKYDLIFMDIGLPDFNGFTVSERIKANCDINRDTPIVALTAHYDEEYQASAKQAGMSYFIPKPLNQQRLIELFEHVKFEESKIGSVNYG